MNIKGFVYLSVFVSALLGTHRVASATSLCCKVADNGSSCQPSTGANNGCVEVGDETCIGGNGDPTMGGPSGCICIAGSCILTTSLDPGQCTNDAAAACCQVGAGKDCPAPVTLVVAQSTPGFLIAKLQNAPATGATGWGEPRVAIDAADDRWVITNAEGSRRVIVFHSADKGQTWVHTPVDPPGQDNPSADTDIVTTRTGRVITVELDGSSLKLVTDFSDDGGKTWAQSSGMMPAASDRPFLAVGPDDPTTQLPRVYLLSVNAENNIVVQTSTDNGATFGPPVAVALPGDPAFADLQCSDGQPAGFSVNQHTGRIYVAIGTQTSPIGGCGASVFGPPDLNVNRPTRIWVATSPDGSIGSWRQSLAVDEGNTSHVVALPFPAAALDTAGNVYVAYPEMNSADDFTAAVRYVHAPPDLSEWSPPVTVAPIGGTAGHILPLIAAGDPGNLDFAYMTGESGSDGKTRWFSTMAQTFDGLGASPHVTEMRLSDSPTAIGTANELEMNCGSGPAKPVEDPTLCAFNRFADLYGVAIDGKGLLTVAWPAASGDPQVDGTWVATQAAGPGLYETSP